MVQIWINANSRTERGKKRESTGLKTNKSNYSKFAKRLDHKNVKSLHFSRKRLLITGLRPDNKGCEFSNKFETRWRRYVYCIRTQNLKVLFNQLPTVL